MIDFSLFLNQAGFVVLPRDNRIMGWVGGPDLDYQDLGIRIANCMALVIQIHGI